MLLGNEASACAVLAPLRWVACRCLVSGACSCCAPLWVTAEPTRQAVCAQSSQGDIKHCVYSHLGEGCSRQPSQHVLPGSSMPS